MDFNRKSIKSCAHTRVLVHTNIHTHLYLYNEEGYICVRDFDKNTLFENDVPCRV